MMSFEDACRRWRPEVMRALPTAADDFVDELTAHVAQRWLDHLARGVSEADADRSSRADLAAWINVPPPARPAPAHPLLGAGLDWRFALRLVRCRPSFAVAATLLTAVAVATASVVTAVVYGVLGRPLPYPDSDRLVTVWESTANGPTQVSYPNYTDLRATGAFDLTAAFGGGTGTFSGGVSVERVKALLVEPVMLSMLGAAPIKGRLLQASDANTGAALISHRLWRTQFGADESVVGRTFSMSGQSHTVVGVLQPGFDFELPVAGTFLLSDHDVWQTLDSTSPLTTRRDVSTYQVLGRLADGVTLEQAQAAASGTADALATRYPATNTGRTFLVTPLRDIVVESARQPLVLAGLGATILVLAALANLGSLALSRFTGRLEELAVRRALGATRLHIVRQLLIEHLPIAAAGGAVGVLGGSLAVMAIATSQAVRLPRPDAIRFDGLPWTVAAAMVLTAWLIVAFLPMVVTRRATALAMNQTRVAGPSSRRSRRTLVAAEITVALVLCSAAAMVSVTLVRLLGVDPGFATSGRLTFRISAYASQHQGKTETLMFFDRLLTGLQNLPGVVQVAAGSSLPLSGQFSGIGILSDSEGRSEAEREPAGWQFVTPGFFAATGTPLIEGRDFTRDEQQRDSHVTILNATLARRLFGDGSAIGRRVQIGGGTDWHEVIGVAGDVRHRSLREAPASRVYDLAGQHWGRTMYVVLHTNSPDVSGLRDAAIRTAAAIDPAAPVFEVAAVDALVGRSVATERLAAVVAAGVALLALLLATLGTHAVVSCSVSERSRELGVRTALGATRSQIVRLVMREAAVMTVAGGTVGVALAVAAARLISSHLYGVDATGALMIVAVVGVAVGLATFAAAVPPAARAATADPTHQLRN